MKLKDIKAKQTNKQTNKQHKKKGIVVTYRLYLVSGM